MKPLMYLKYLRICNSLTQQKMAKILGIGQSTYTQKENGLYPFTEWEVKRLVEFFNTAYEDIFGSSFKRDYSNERVPRKRGEANEQTNQPN